MPAISRGWGFWLGWRAVWVVMMLPLFEHKMSTRERWNNATA
jgi:hypothetical protein